MLSVSAALLTLGAVGCSSDGGDTTINQTTTVIREQVPSDTDGDGGRPLSDGPEQEFSGSCDASREATPSQTGFAQVEVIEASCEYAAQVAQGFVSAYGPDCFQGCTKFVEGIRCETQPPIHAEVVCAAARTEVRFAISGED